MSELKSRTDYLVWFRPSNKEPWRVIHWTQNFKLAVNCVGIGYKGHGDWYLLPVLTYPKDESYSFPAKAELPTKITSLSQIAGREAFNSPF